MKKKASNVFSFNSSKLDNLPLPKDGKRLVFRDDKTPYLNLIVYETGRKNFYIYRAVKGVPRRIKLGGYPELTVNQARELAGRVNWEIAQGTNIDDIQLNRKGKGITLAELFKEYLENYAKLHKKTWREDERIFIKYLECWHSKLLKELIRRDIEKLHAHIGSQYGKIQANRVLALLSCLFNKAISWEYFKENNPCLGIKRFKEKTRERFLQPNEMVKFFRGLNDETNTTARDFILMALLTGARKSTVFSMAWVDVDLKQKVWNIADSKNGISQRLPLVEDAVLLLEQRKKISQSKWVFPSRFTNEKHMTQPFKPFKRVCQRAGLKDLCIHDLRRSLGSWLAINGKSSILIGRVLNHKSPISTAVYARLHTDPIREAMNEIVDLMKVSATCNT